MLSRGGQVAFSGYFEWRERAGKDERVDNVSLEFSKFSNCAPEIHSIRAITGGAWLSNARISAALIRDTELLRLKSGVKPDQEGSGCTDALST